MIRFRFLTVILRRFWVTERWEVWLIWFLSLKWMSSIHRSITRIVLYVFLLLKYASVIKWFTNQSDGIPAYIKIDMATQNTELVKLEKGMKYTTSDHFNRNIYRHLRFEYSDIYF